MVYGELGVSPLNISIKTRMSCYWAKIVSTDNAKLTSMLYRLLYIKLVNEGILCPWMDFVRNQLNFLWYWLYLGYAI